MPSEIKLTSMSCVAILPSYLASHFLIGVSWNHPQISSVSELASWGAHVNKGTIQLELLDWESEIASVLAMCSGFLMSMS